MGTHPLAGKGDLGAVVEAMLTAADGFDDITWEALDRVYEASQTADGYWMHRGPRDYAREACSAATGAARREIAVRALSHELLRFGPRHWWGVETALDAMWATLMADQVDEGPFTRADYDCLMAPWRAVTLGCARSRVFLNLAAKSVGPAAALWPVVDAVLAAPADGERPR